MLWELSNRADPRARALADRHYNRQKPGTKQFVPPGRCLVLYSETDTGGAFWVTSWPYPQYVRHAWPDAWVCSAFRNEGAARASTLIREAIALTRGWFGEPPPLGMVTFIDQAQVRPTLVRGVPTWGYCYIKVGFVEAGRTKGGLLALQLRPERMPDPIKLEGFS